MGLAFALGVFVTSRKIRDAAEHVVSRVNNAVPSPRLARARDAEDGRLMLSRHPNPVNVVNHFEAPDKAVCLTSI